MLLEADQVAYLPLVILCSSARRAISVLGSTILLAGGAAVLAAAPAAAATATFHHDGIVVRVPTSRTVSGSGKVKITPVAHRKGTAKRVVVKRTIYVSRSGHRVASGASVRLRAGTYRVKVAVTYRKYSTATKPHQVRTHYGEDFLDNVSCTVREADNDPDTGDYYVVRADCTSPKRPGQTAHDSYTETDTPGPYTVGQKIVGDFVDFPAYTRVHTVTGPVRVYGKNRHYTTPKRTLVITKHPGGTGSGGSGGSCHPLTNGGNCYEPGEFCRNTDHGVHGVAGNGEAIVCEDNNGWRWEPV